ncbi:uncharacterized protein LOC102617006 isoform X2 [Citrus sinensis]|uniref:uncharacterized protein LOC102617006 isoform X2 n=1 Tax=Citrus sinensis TaxID=2711 RepID=UPI00076371BD|nr:uncharacterized protein LOC102617006 isoform X2 [Citrus sinensis]
MPLSRSSSTKEVGLRLLFCPLGSNIILRTACSSVGVALPVYSRQLRGKIKMSNTSGSCIGQLMEVLALLRYLQTSFLLGKVLDPNQPEGCNAVEDLDGITSDTDIESDLEVLKVIETLRSLEVC